MKTAFLLFDSEIIRVIKKVRMNRLQGLKPSIKATIIVKIGNGIVLSSSIELGLICLAKINNNIKIIKDINKM